MNSNHERRLHFIAGGVAGAALMLIVSGVTSPPNKFALLLLGLTLGFMVTALFNGAAREQVNALLGIYRSIPWDWFKFNSRIALVFTTVIALYFGAVVTWGRILGLNHSEVFSYSAEYVIWGTVQIAAYCIASVPLIHRWEVHPRASKLALLSIAIAAGVIVFSTLYTMSYYAAVWDQYGLLELFTYWAWWIVALLGHAICLGLIVAAVLVDRGATATQSADQQNEEVELPEGSPVDSRGHDDQPS